MPIFRYHAQGSPQGAPRRAPAGMPTRVPLAKPAVQRPPKRDALPPQKPITDEPAPAAPSKWKRFFKRAFALLGVVFALALAYVFLLMGEPGEDDQLLAETVQEESIRVPIAASEMGGDTDISPLAVNFGKPVLAFGSNILTLQKATLYDTAFQGGYARRLTLLYAFADGSICTVESIRPTAAVALLAGDQYRLDVQTLYTLAGMDAVRMDSDTQICLVARGTGAVYAVNCPQNHAADLNAIIGQIALMQPAAI